MCLIIPEQNLDQAQKKRRKSLAVKVLRKRERKRRRRRRREAILRKCLSSQLVSNVMQVLEWCVMIFFVSLSVLFYLNIFLFS